MGISAQTLIFEYFKASALGEKSKADLLLKRIRVLNPNFLVETQDPLEVFNTYYDPAKQEAAQAPLPITRYVSNSGTF